MAQVGDFSSTTTVIGLPSTPARNTSRHPQARRAWLKPLSMNPFRQARARSPTPVRSYYTARRSRLEQSFDVGLVFRLPDEPGILVADAAIPVDDERRRDAPHRAVGVLQVVAIAADEHGVVHLVLRGEILQHRRRVVRVHRDADKLQALWPVGVLQLDKSRDLGLARGTPRRPEVEDEHLALERCEADLLAVHVGDREIEVRLLRVD